MYCQNKFDYKVERNKFNIGLIEKNKTDKTYDVKINNDEKFEGRYLGMIRTISGIKYHIIISSYIFDIGALPKTENHIFIYNDKNKYVGYYYLSQMYELPKRLDKNNLYFKNKNCREESTVNFDDEIPKAINLKCNGENNYYEFQN
jgi:hypothetical protein